MAAGAAVVMHSVGVGGSAGRRVGRVVADQLWLARGAAWPGPGCPRLAQQRAGVRQALLPVPPAERLPPHGCLSCPQGGGRGALKLSGGATGPTEVIKSVLDTDRTGAKEEIFVDIVEKLTAIFDAGGHQKSSSIVGAIQVGGGVGWERAVWQRFGVAGSGGQGVAAGSSRGRPGAGPYASRRQGKPPPHRRARPAAAAAARRRSRATSAATRPSGWG